MAPSPLNASVLPVLLTIMFFGQVQAHAPNHLVRRAYQPEVTDSIARLRINDDEEYVIVPEPGFPLHEIFTQGPKEISLAELIAGPAGVGCFFWSPLRNSRDYFISPILRIPVEKEQQDDTGEETASVPASSVDDDDDNDSKMSIPSDQPPFPADKVFYYKFGPSDDRIYVFVEYDDGWGLYTLLPVQFESFKGPEVGYSYSANNLRNVQRVAVVAGPKLNEIECNLIGMGRPKISPSFNSRIPLMNPFSRLLGVFCQVGPTYLAEAPSKTNFKFGSKSVSNTDPASSPSPPWWKFWG